MQVIIISDSSCLILLYKIDQLDLLQKLFGNVYITQIIAKEFAKDLPEWILIQNPTNSKNQILLESSLDKGEASAIALAMEQSDCLLIIDELKGRKFAQKLGIKITGTLGIIADAKLKGHLPEVKPVLEKVKQTNFRLTESLERAILKRVGE